VRNARALLALLAAVLHVAAPAAAGAAPHGAPAPLEICTAHGIAYVPAPADGGSAPARAAPDHCPACAFHGAAAPAAAPGTPGSAALPEPAAVDAPGMPARLPCTAARPRAPPLPS
jgi:hypothetical protein